MASTGAWKGHAKLCFHNDFNTSLSRYWQREKKPKEKQIKANSKHQTIYMSNHTQVEISVLYLQLVGLTFRSGDVQHLGWWRVWGQWWWGRGRILAVACLQSVSHRCGGLKWLSGQFRRIGPGRGRWERVDPVRPLHSSLNSLEGDNNKSIVITASTVVVSRTNCDGLTGEAANLCFFSLLVAKTAVFFCLKAEIFPNWLISILLTPLHQLHVHFIFKIKLEDAITAAQYSTLWKISQISQYSALSKQAKTCVYAICIVIRVFNILQYDQQDNIFVIT